MTVDFTKIRNERERRGWSQEMLAEYADLSVRTVQRLEKGMPVSPTSIRSLARAFEVDPEDLVKAQKSKQQETTLKLECILHAKNLSPLVAHTHLFSYDYPENLSDSESDILTEFFNFLEIYEIWNEISPGDRIKYENELQQNINEIGTIGMRLFAGTTMEDYQVAGKPMAFRVAVLKILRETE